MVKKIVTQQKKSRDSNTEPFVQRKLCADTVKKNERTFFNWKISMLHNTDAYLLKETISGGLLKINIMPVCSRLFFLFAHSFLSFVVFALYDHFHSHTLHKCEWRSTYNGNFWCTMQIFFLFHFFCFKSMIKWEHHMVSFHEIANDNVALQLNRPLIELIFLNLTWVLFLWSRLHVILSFGVFFSLHFI